METEIHPNRFDADELSLLQGRALRSWMDSQWLAINKPREANALDDFPEGQIWMDIGGGQVESEQTPGAIVIGQPQKGAVSKRTGETRNIDLEWSILDGLPSNDHLVDRIISPESTFTKLSPSEQDILLRECARVLRVGGTLTIDEEDGSLASRVANDLQDLGFVRETKDDDGDDECIFTLTRSSSPMREVGRPNIKEVVMGKTEVRPLRTLTPTRR